MDILLQDQSKGIHYEGYDVEFIQCVFEDGSIDGKNEQYIFRCSPDKECCGRVCCVPQPEIVPFWLIIVFIVLAILLLLCLLGLLGWFCNRRKIRKPGEDNTPKKAPVIRPYGRDAKYSGYRTIDDDEPPLPLPSESIPTSKTTPNREKVAVDNHTYSTPTDNITPTATDTTRTNHGYGNPMFGRVPPNGSTNMVVSTQQTYSTDRHGGRHDSDHDDRNVRHDVMVAQRSDAERSGDTGIDTTHRFGDNHFTNSRASALRGDPDNRSSSKSGSVITVREGPTFRNLPPGFTRETFSEKFEENYKIEGPTIGRNHFESRELL